MKKPFRYVSLDLSGLVYLFGVLFGILVMAFVDLAGMVVVITANPITMIQKNTLDFLLTAAPIHFLFMLIYFIFGIGATFLVYKLVDMSDNTPNDKQLISILLCLVMWILGLMIVTTCQPILIDYWMRLKEIGRFGLNNIEVLYLNNVILTLFLGVIIFCVGQGANHLKKDIVKD